MLDIHSAATSQDKNVHGLERASSLAGGALMVSKGLRHGGLVGLLQIAVGGLALARGFERALCDQGLVAAAPAGVSPACVRTSSAVLRNWRR
ncbi:hypothetical protein PPS11_30641 [Pseudomonas putida S11]|nr:hypothetical protein PPS11_30641 [Pseudomonas putida S11]